MEWLEPLSRLGAELAIVVCFLWYLRGKDIVSKELAHEGHEAVRLLAIAVGELKSVIDRLLDERKHLD